MAFDRLMAARFTAGLCFLALSCFGTSAAVDAAEIRKLGAGQHERCSHILEGKIEPGDLAKFQSVFRVEDSNDNISILCMNSQGGNFAEGIEIALYLREAAVGTHVDKTNTCLSACAIAFMGGRIALDDSSGPRRSLEPGGLLGFHAPEPDISFATNDRVLIETAYTSAISAIGHLTESVESIDFPLTLLARLLRSHGPDFHYIDDIGDVVRYDIDLVIKNGIEPSRGTIINACDYVFSLHRGDRRLRGDADWFRLGNYTNPEFAVISDTSEQLIAIAGLYPPEALSLCRVTFDKRTSVGNVELLWDPRNTDGGVYHEAFVDKPYFLSPDVSLEKLADVENRQ